jgi:hypothetical protein
MRLTQNKDILYFHIFYYYPKLKIKKYYCYKNFVFGYLWKPWGSRPGCPVVNPALNYPPVDVNN